MEFAKAGADVVVASRRIENLERVAGDIKALGQRSLAIATDVRKAGDIDRLVQKTVQEFGKLDILVNNAGIDLSKPLVEVSEEEWDAVMDVNLKSVFLGCKYAIPHMISGGGGVITNISSCLGIMGAPFVTAYGASKAGIVMLTKDLALELRRHNIRVNALCPGIIDTDMYQTAVRDPESYAGRGLLKVVASRQGRVGKSEEVASAALFLSSEESSFITGHSLSVDGGYAIG